MVVCAAALAAMVSATISASTIRTRMTRPSTCRPCEAGTESSLTFRSSRRERKSKSGADFSSIGVADYGIVTNGVIQVPKVRHTLWNDAPSRHRTVAVEDHTPAERRKIRAIGLFEQQTGSATAVLTAINALLAESRISRGAAPPPLPDDERQRVRRGNISVLPCRRLRSSWTRRARPVCRVGRAKGKSRSPTSSGRSSTAQARSRLGTTS